MIACGLVAQLDRVFDYESKGRGFESRRAHQGAGSLENQGFQLFLQFFLDHLIMVDYTVVKRSGLDHLISLLDPLKTLDLLKKCLKGEKN